MMESWSWEADLEQGMFLAELLESCTLFVEKCRTFITRQLLIFRIGGRWFYCLRAATAIICIKVLDVIIYNLDRVSVLVGVVSGHWLEEIRDKPDRCRDISTHNTGSLYQEWVGCGIKVKHCFSSLLGIAVLCQVQNQLCTDYAARDVLSGRDLFTGNNSVQQLMSPPSNYSF